MPWLVRYKTCLAWFERPITLVPNRWGSSRPLEKTLGWMCSSPVGLEGRDGFLMSPGSWRPSSDLGRTTMGSSLQFTAIWTTWQGLLPMQILQGEPERSLLYKEFLTFVSLCFHYQLDFFNWVCVFIVLNMVNLGLDQENYGGWHICCILPLPFWCVFWAHKVQSPPPEKWNNTFSSMWYIKISNIFNLILCL